MADFKLFIDGEYADAASGETFTTNDPATGQAIGEVAKGGKEDSQRAIQAARKAFDEGPWPRMSGKERGEKLNEIADAIDANAKLLPVFGKSQVSMFELAGIVGKHLG